MNTKEIECRFLDVDKETLVKKLLELGAKDDGEILIEETVIYDQELNWRDEQKVVRIRQVGEKTKLTFKDHKVQTVDGTFEIEFGIDDYKKAELFFEKIGLRPFRHQQKRRHSFKMDGVMIDIDSWPMIPPYVEFEGDSENDLKKVAKKLGFSWKDADFHNALWVIENIYHIPVGKFQWYTFKRCE